MIKKIEHIGIAVKDINTSNKLFEKLLGIAPYKTETVESEHVITSFFQIGDIKIELLQATSEISAIYKFIEKKGEGIHHIAFDTDNIQTEMKLLHENSFELINKTPKEGADNKNIIFLHPKSTNSVLVEICEEK